MTWRTKNLFALDLIPTARRVQAASAACVLLLCLGAFPATLQAELPELVTDRPDQTESSVAVPPGYWQLETGWTWTRDEEGDLDVQTQEVPGTLLRIGLVRGLELRLGWAGWVSEKTEIGSFSERLEGTGDGELGFKWVLREGEQGGPAMAILGGTSVPVGERGFSSERFDPSLRLTVAHGLSPRAELAYNLGVEWATEAEGGQQHTLSNILYTLALGLDLGERLGAFVEVFGTEAASSQEPGMVSFDGGFTWAVGDNLQLDAAVGLGLNDAAPDLFVGLGLSYLSPW